MKIYMYKYIGDGLNEEVRDWSNITVKYFSVSGNIHDVFGWTGDGYIYLSQVNKIFERNDWCFFSFRKLNRREVKETIKNCL